MSSDHKSQSTIRVEGLAVDSSYQVSSVEVHSNFADFECDNLSQVAILLREFVGKKIWETDLPIPCMEQNYTEDAFELCGLAFKLSNGITLYLDYMNHEFSCHLLGSLANDTLPDVRFPEGWLQEKPFKPTPSIVSFLSGKTGQVLRDKLVEAGRIKSEEYDELRLQDGPID